MSPPTIEPCVSDDADPLRSSPIQAPTLSDMRTGDDPNTTSSTQIPLAHQQHLATRDPTPTRDVSPVPSITSSTSSDFRREYRPFMRLRNLALEFEKTDGDRGRKTTELDSHVEEEKQRWQGALSKATTASRGKDPDLTREKNSQTTQKGKKPDHTHGTNSRTTLKEKELYNTSSRTALKGKEPDNTQGTNSEVQIRVAEEREKWRTQLLSAANASVSKMDELKNAIKARDAALAFSRAENDSWKAELAMLKSVAGRKETGTMSSEEKERLLQLHIARTAATSQGNAVNMQKTIAALERDLQHARVENRMQKGDVESLQRALSDAKKREKAAVEEGESLKRSLNQSTMHHAAMKNSLESLHKQHVAVVQQLGEARSSAIANTDPLQTVIADLQRENQQLKLSDARLHAYNLAIYKHLQECQATLAAERSNRNSTSNLAAQPAQPETAQPEAEEGTPSPRHSVDTAGATEVPGRSQTDDIFNSAQQAAYVGVKERLSVVEASLVQERALLLSSTEAWKIVHEKLEREKAEALTAAQEAKKDLESLKSTFKSMAAEFDRKKRNEDRLSKELAERSAELQRIQERLRSLEDTVANLRQEKQALRGELDACKHQLALAQKDAAVADSELGSSRRSNVCTG